MQIIHDFYRVVFVIRKTRAIDTLTEHMYSVAFVNGVALNTRSARETLLPVWYIYLCVLLCV